MGESVSRASSSSDGAFVLVVEGWPSEQGDVGWIPVPTCGMILGLASVPRRWLNLGSEHGRQDSSFSAVFMHKASLPVAGGLPEEKRSLEPKRGKDSRATASVTAPPPGGEARVSVLKDLGCHRHRTNESVT